jgi:hypothetical protein
LQCVNGLDTLGRISIDQDLLETFLDICAEVLAFPLGGAEAPRREDESSVSP